MQTIIEPAIRTPVLAQERFWVALAFIAAITIWEMWIKFDAARYLSGRPPKKRSRPELQWESLRERAQAVVSDTIQELPEEVKAEAGKVPCLLREWAQDLRGRDALGIYSGFEAGRCSEQGGPIVLFLGDLFQYCSDHSLDFDEEVKKTYLHELGHHLGWDEHDLEARGLD